MNKNLHQHIFNTSTCLRKEELDAYTHGKLSSSERYRVENHLLDCPLCTEAVEGFQQATSPAARQLESFSAFKKKLPRPSQGVIHKLEPRPQLRLALAFAALLIVGLVAYLALFQSPSSNKLYKEYYSFYENDIPLSLRSTDSAQLLSPALEQALNSYSTRQFVSSIPNFERALEEDPDNVSARFFAGLAYLEAGQPEMAAAHLEKVSHQSSSYSQKAEWYLILTHLNMGEKDKAKSLLEEYVKHGSFKTKEAAALLSRL